MYAKGDRVVVQGLNDKTAILRVWAVKEHGLLLCTDEGYHLGTITGDDPIAVGFPISDIKGLYGMEQT